MDLCRACMINDRVNTLHSLSKNDEIIVLFNQFTSLNINLSDGLPNFLCTSCVDKLKEFKVFKQKCLDSNLVLKENLTVKNDEKPDVKLNEFLYTNEIFDTLTEGSDVVPIPVVVEVDVPETSNNKNSETVKSDSSDSEADDPPAENNDGDSDVPSEMDSDEEWSRKHVAESKLAAKEKTEEPAKADEPEPAEEIDSDEEWSRKYVAEAELAAKKKKRAMQSRFTSSYKCERCGLAFRYEERLLGHMREHEGHRAAVCEFCNREYSEWSGLQKHVYRCHRDEMKYICVTCGKKFIYESALETHKIKHSGPRKHICETCGKAFSNLYLLNKHKLAHTDKTPFECEECGKKFKSIQRLKTHQYRHTGIKKFVCQTCGKGFTTSPELRQHLSVHSDKKEFQCTVCQQVFKQRSQMSAHRRSHMF